MNEQEKREKVIKGLEWCMNEKHDCYREKGCPYENEGEDIGCKYALHRDALILLKAQEPVVMAGAELTDTELIEKIRKAPIVLKPTVDAVSVVLCKDCKHRDPEDKKCNCGDMTVQGLYFPRPDTWYCPNGERRDEDAACGW